jgi:hypothetical protein
MSEPIERVAKAIFDHMFAEHEHVLWDTDDFLRNNYLDCARAAIAAMREPTPEMWEAGRMKWKSSQHASVWSKIVPLYQAMIDEMLK